MSVFHFKHFSIQQKDVAMKVGTDAMLLGALVNVDGKKSGLDIGAGTGVLTLMMVQRNEELIVDAVELDPQSAQECTLNFSASDWSERLRVHCVNFSDYTPDVQYDLIVSNPPFYESTLLNNDGRKADARHAQSLPMPVLVDRASSCLSDMGDFWLIVPFEYETGWIEECRKHDLFLLERISILGKSDGDIRRVVLRFSRVEASPMLSQLAVRDKNGDYTSEYRGLTAEFHNKPV